MKLVRYKTNGAGKYGILEDGFVYAVAGDVYSGEFKKGEPVGGIEAVALLPPCEPKTITSIGANYASRCKENNMKIPTEPGMGDRFLIPVEALTGPGGLIYIPADETRVDYSGELGIVMRRECQNVKAEDAADYILGYTIIHNVWGKGKPCERIRSLLKQRKEGIRAYESFCPAGPCVVTDIDPSNIPWETRVNGEVRQKSNTSKMLFDVYEIVASISTWNTLLPGDLIQCGTASGVGLLNPGDVVDIEFEGIGILSNLGVAKDEMQPINLVWVDEYEGKN